MRPSMDSPRIVLPANSITCPTPPPMLILSVTARIRSFADTPRPSAPVTINCLQPGRIRSEQIDQRYPTDESRREFALAEIPMERFGEPEELASFAIFLSSPLAGYITGTAIPVDGGMSRFAF
jgi:NAD(P)-dependent dehydrogenase (short-subunit alcohol dehydrogenase family)